MSLSHLQTALNSRLALPLKELDALSTYLTREWEMYCFSELTEGFRRFYRSQAKGFVAFQAACAERSAKMTDPAAETQADALAFYTKLSNPPFGPWVMGARWPHIISSLASVDELCTAIKPTRVLEVGCGFGFAGKWLGTKHPIDYLGIDFCADAIKAGRARTQTALKDPVTRREKIYFERDSVRFAATDIYNFSPPQNRRGEPIKYDLIFSIAGMPSETDGRLIDTLSDHLSPEGLIYMHVSGAPGFASTWGIKPSKLDLIFEDSTGGLAHGASGYEHTSGYVFGPKKCGLRPAIFHPSESWEDFADCMNSGEIHERERNFAYFNSYGRPKKAWKLVERKWDYILPKGHAWYTPTPRIEPVAYEAAPLEPKKKPKPKRSKMARKKQAEIKKTKKRVRARADRLKRLLQEIKKSKRRR